MLGLCFLLPALDFREKESLNHREAQELGATLLCPFPVALTLMETESFLSAGALGWSLSSPGP